jgi:hypothetical protein
VWERGQRWSGGLKREVGDLGRAVEAQGQADGAEAAVDVELEVAEAEVAFDVLLAHGGEDHGTDDGETDLAAVGVAGEHVVDALAGGVGSDVVGVVGGVGHEDDGTIGVGGHGFGEVGAGAGGIFDASDPEAAAVALDGDVLVEEDGSAAFAQDAGDEGGTDGGIVIAEAGEALGTGDLFEDFGAGVDGVLGERAGRAVGDEVAGDEDEIGSEGVDVADDVAEEDGFGEVVEVDVGDLDDAEVVEGLGEIRQEHGAAGELELVAGELAGVEAECAGGEDGGLEEAAAGDERGRGWTFWNGFFTSHTSF